MTEEPNLPDWWATTYSALDAKMGLEVTELTPERTVGSMPVEGNTQPYGLWHGGASGVLAETLASIHLGRRVTSYEVVISHESGVRVATARVTCHVLRPGHDDPTDA